MKMPKLSKENILIAFYTIYILIAGIAYELFPTHGNTPNGGVLMLYLFIPISIIYFMVHLVKQLYGNQSYAKCLLIHGVVWLSIAVILSAYAK
jgi:tryptophan-rich sensory protein